MRGRAKAGVEGDGLHSGREVGGDRRHVQEAQVLHHQRDRRARQVAGDAARRLRLRAHQQCDARVAYGGGNDAYAQKARGTQRDKEQQRALVVEAPQRVGRVGDHTDDQRADDVEQQQEPLRGLGEGRPAAEGPSLINTLARLTLAFLPLLECTTRLH